ncbi:sigma-70 family RNA polymerase sigma factor [Hoeflea sp. EC-HK425]|uniref:RNA polymerase sigma factor n=1 Tax=Hoeflea sp. EC-HK425 TaxID=2038388 RepID=UPI001FCE4EB2|nr:sigma-70 family RNA polymerase sigma factor [Hoeflea sp. EC-HK425]
MGYRFDPPDQGKHQNMPGDTKKNLLDGFATSYLELRRYLARRFGSRIEPEDVLQDTFLRLQNVPAEAEIKNTRSYLFRAAANQATDHIRARQAFDRRFDLSDGPEHADEAPSPEAVADYRQRLKMLERAVLDLPARQREVFLLHKIDGLSHAEIASELGITRSAVEKLVMKALAHLRDSLGDVTG